MSLWPKIEKILHRVEKPMRYVGAEIGAAAARDDSDVEASIVLAFPDLYEIGTSYHGFKVLYERINDSGRFRAERTFAPWVDFERQMRSEAIPLYTVESFRPVRDFDIIGFTLQHELNYTNILNMLDLAGLALRAQSRRDPLPLVIGGGEGALAPEPLAPFFDAFVLGDGEEVVLEILDLIAQMKRRPGATKADFLEALDRIEGVYVPAFVEFRYAADGTIAAIGRTNGGGKGVGSADERTATRPLFERRVFDIAGDSSPAHPVVPLARTVHDRLVVEIRRGCTRGCRFCSSGMITRPVRERPPEQVLEIVERGLGHTGYRDVSLLSLSSGDYSQIAPLINALIERFGGRRVSVSLPSLRISEFDVALAERISEVRKTGFTFAPEAGTERLRAVINKPLADEEFFGIVDRVCRAGWRTIKLYFMVGLPTETDEDLDGIVRMVRRVEEIGRSYWKGRLKINVSVAPFVPKPHTPFQWEAQVEREELARRYRKVASALKRMRCVHLKRHGVEEAFVEAVLTRGDRRVADAIEKAWRLGCRLDAWSDRFDFSTWMRAFEDTGIDPTWYANRRRGDSEILPWDHIAAGPSRQFLLGQREAALRGEMLEDCTRSPCYGCGACENGPSHRLAEKAPQVAVKTKGKIAETDPRKAPRTIRGRKTSARPSRGPESAMQPSPRQRLRLSYSKSGRLRFLSHLDMVKVWQLLVERARLPVAYSRGFHPVALLQYSPPLPVGYEARGEWVDIFLHERLDPKEAAARLDEAAPEGMRVFAPVEINLEAPALDRSIAAAEYEIELARESVSDGSLSPETIRKCWVEARREAATLRDEGQDNPRLRAASIIESLEPARGTENTIRLKIRKDRGNLSDPVRLLNALLGAEMKAGEGVKVTRLGLFGAAPPPPRPRRVGRRRR